MIEIHLSGGLGVRLFQYVFAYIISYYKDDCLEVVESQNYKENYEKTKNRKYYYFESMKQIFPKLNKKIFKKNNYLNDTKMINGHVHNLEELINYKGKLILKGSGFQRYEYYKKYKTLIKELLYIPEEKKVNFNKNDVVIHYRLGDTKTELLKKKIRINEKYLGYSNYQNMTPDYFLNILNENQFEKIYLVTDSPKDTILEPLKKINGLEIISKNQYDDFLFLSSAPNLIICHSTFSWWAAFLSNASKVYMPKTNFNNNIKYHAEWIYRNDICLNVDDQERYIYK